MVKDFFKDLCTDEKLEIDGIWHQCSGLFDTIKIKVARFNNKNFQDLYNDLYIPYAKYDKPHSLIPDSVKKEKSNIMIEAVAKTILLGWEGVFAEGKKFEYSTENAKRMLAKNDFFLQVLSISQQAENFRQVEIEENAKNLKKPSSGN